MYEPPHHSDVSERTSTQAGDGARLRPVRSGRFADPATALAWAVGAAATVYHPAGLAVAGLLLGVVATSVERAVASGASFGIVAAGAGIAWLVSTGSLPPGLSLSFVEALLLSLLAPPAVAAIVRAIL